MSTPSITAPGAIPGASARRHDGARKRLRRLARGGEADPRWSRPLLWLVAVLAGALTLWGLTRNGYANTYYAQAAQAASRSWTAWLTNALDVSGSDSLDKGPLSNMLMGLSGRVFGFSSFSMLLPEALCGIASVLLLHNVVRRTLGARAAILAALMLALTPIFVAMSRFNNPDALLVLSEIAAAWALVRALESGRTRYVLLCGTFVGLAFNVKMLQADLIVPGLALTLLVTGAGGLRRRFAQAATGAGAMLAVSFAWYGTMMLIPAADRPWVGDTTDNSWFTLLFGANGLSRVSGTGGGAGAGFGGQPGALRLFNSAVGGQIAWLLPLALGGLALGLWSRRHAGRSDRARSAYLLWGAWGVVSWAVFSFSRGVFHPYYTTALAPAVAVLSAGGLVVLWDRSRRSAAWAAGLSLSLIGTTILSASLLGRAQGFLPWLAPLALGLALAAASVIMLSHIPRARVRAGSRWVLAAAAPAALVAILAGPTSYSIATVGRSLTGSNPLAGPANALADAGFGGGEAPGAGPRTRGPASASRRASRGAPQVFRPPAQARSGVLGVIGNPPSARGALGSPPGGRGAIGEAGGGMDYSVSKATVHYLEAHQGGARYLAAAVGSTTAGSLALQSGRDVIDIGGFMGSDPSPTLSQLKGLVSRGELHYVLLNSAGAPGGFSSSATRARDSWVESHGKVVKVTGEANAAITLYYVASAG